MRPRRPILSLSLLLAAAALAPSAAAAQDTDDDWLERCRRNHRDSDREVHCEVRESRLAARGALTVDGAANGGVSVEAWDRNEVLVRARVQAVADTEARAREIAGQVRVETGGATLRAEGPRTGRREWWAVSYRVFAPRRTDLTLTTNNGPVSVEGVEGTMRLRTTNGPINLRSVAGHVHGRATNGPVNVTLDGDRWRGAGLDVEATNGPVSVEIPRGYAAHLETGTTNGPMQIDFPVTVQGRIGRRISTDLNGGGPTIRAVTTNGPVTIRER